jgi:hypothetical protein
MRKPSPELLDLFYRSGAFPIDDLDVRDYVGHTSAVMASTWFVPTQTIPAIFFVMGGGSGDLSALIHELRRLAVVTGMTTTALSLPIERRGGKQSLCYHYFVQVTHVDARVYAKSVEEWDEALTPLLHTSVLHPWFRPQEEYAEVYKTGYVSVTNLPETDFADRDAADYLGDPEVPVAKRATRATFGGSREDDVDDNETDASVLDRGDARGGKGGHKGGGYAGFGNAGALDDPQDDFDTSELTSLSDIRLSAEDRKFLKIQDDME